MGGAAGERIEGYGFGQVLVNGPNDGRKMHAGIDGQDGILDPSCCHGPDQESSDIVFKRPTSARLAANVSESTW